VWAILLTCVRGTMHAGLYDMYSPTLLTLAGTHTGMRVRGSHEETTLSPDRSDRPPKRHPSPWAGGARDGADRAVCWNHVGLAMDKGVVHIRLDPRGSFLVSERQTCTAKSRHVARRDICRGVQGLHSYDCRPPDKAVLRQQHGIGPSEAVAGTFISAVSIARFPIHAASVPHVR